MDANELEKRAKDVLNNRFIGFETTEKETQSIIDILKVLANRGISIDCGLRILKDARKVLTRIVTI